jgi:hypothetical protein
MRCPDHGTESPCLFCEWASSGVPTYERAAAGRADAVAGRPRVVRAVADPAPRPTTPGLARSREANRLSRECPARYKDATCGCCGMKCVLRFGGLVSYSDCEKCLVSRGVELPPVK